MKRTAPAQGTDNKKARMENGDLEIPQPDIEEVQPLRIPSFVEELKALKAQEIANIKKLLASAYVNAPLAMENSNIHAIADQDWGELEYEPGSRSLAEILYNEGGWTEANMLKFIGQSPVPFNVPPLSNVESRALWASIRYQVLMKHLHDAAKFDISLPEEWLGMKLKYKEFGKKGGVDFTKKLAATIEYNQSEFIGKRDYWFRPLCEKFGGFVLSENFEKYHLVSIFVICCDPDLLVSSVADIPGTWGSNARFKFTTAWTTSVKKAIQEGTVKYPSTLKLFKNLFPKVLM